MELEKRRGEKKVANFARTFLLPDVLRVVKITLVVFALTQCDLLGARSRSLYRHMTEPGCS